MSWYICIVDIKIRIKPEKVKVMLTKLDMYRYIFCVRQRFTKLIQYHLRGPLLSGLISLINRTVYITVTHAN